MFQPILKLLAMAFLTLKPAAIALPPDPFMGLLINPTMKIHRVPMGFHGLHFTRDADLVSCTPDKSDKLSCRVVVKDNLGHMKAQAQIDFLKNSTGSKTAISLLRFNRKKQWMERNSTLKQYVEAPIRVGDFESILQQAQYFRLNNSFWPVLIRAVDVVVSQVISVSVTITTDANDWPFVEKELDDLVRSFSKKA